MLRLFRAFLQICLFKAGPQDLPDSGFLMRSVLVVNILFSFAYLLGQLTPYQALYQVILSMAVLYMLTKLVLGVRNVPYRFRQTFTAVLGADLVLTLLQSVLVSSGILPMQPEEITQIQALLWLVLVFWGLAVQGNILHHALNVSRFTGAMLSIWFLLITVIVLNAFSSTPPA